MQRVSISKEIQFDAGHRVPRHGSKCRNLHGHRYVVTVECGGQIIDEPGAPDEGMLIDFGDLKTIMTEEIHDRFDHGFIVYEGDTACIAALQNLQQLEPEHTLKVITVDFIPTAENIALWVANQLRPIIEHHWRGNLWLEGVTVWETPTSVAYVSEVRREVG